MIRAFSTKLRDDSISAFAAQAAFFVILSFFPFVMFLLTLLHYLPFSPEQLYSLSMNLFPDVIDSFIGAIITELSEKSSGTILSVTVIAALWSASRGTLALLRGLNSVYRHKETRSYLRLRAVSTLYTFVFALLLIVSLVLLVFGNQLYELILKKLPFLSDFALLLISARSLITMLIMTFFFLLLYLFVPNRKSHILRELPGALLSAGGWLGFSYLFSYYIDHMGNFSYTYGSLTAIVICMLWLYACMYILFIGAEVNVVLSMACTKR
ncbi:MAG: YihY/virulence factor BrkB family protein [Lachnospiraceae bacterium]